MKLAIVGGGIMGEAVIRSVIRKKIYVSSDIVVSDVLEERKNILKKKYKINTAASNQEAIENVSVIVFAVKPQDFVSVLEAVSNLMKKQLVMSIVAGFSLDSICKNLNYDQVVRAMPNMPAQIGKGMTAWTAKPSLRLDNHETARKILSAMGEEYFFSDEKYLDMATAINGSGPAYIFLFIESLVDAGVHIGLPRDVSHRLVIETIVGSAEAVKQMSKHPAELKNMVTSPGGTTTEALLLLENGGIRSLIINAVAAAYNKAKNLGVR
jgi:pyrroline-5-carboxylate reductase